MTSAAGPVEGPGSTSGRATRIDAAFDRCRAEGRAAIIPYLTGGYPNQAAFETTLLEMARAGADIIEIGIPFSDPIADGPVIAEAMHAALQAGATPESIFAVVRRVRERVASGANSGPTPGATSGPTSGTTSGMGVALVAMVSVSIVERIGVARFVDAAAECGLDGLIVPDLDLEDAAPLAARCAERGVATILLVAPTSSPERVARITSLCRGFVYVLAQVGVTGERSTLPEGLARRLAALRTVTTLPLAVGFGIASPEQVAAVAAHADGVIVGSSIVRRMADPADAASEAVVFLRSLQPALRRAVVERAR